MSTPYITRDSKNKLVVRTDPAKVAGAVYRSTAGKEIVIEDGVFVERSLDGRDSKQLFAAS